IRMGSGVIDTRTRANADPEMNEANSRAAAAPATIPIRRICTISAVPLVERLEADHSPSQPGALAIEGRHPITYGSRPRNRARLMARASSRCFFADTAVMRLGTILPRSET